MPSVAKYDGFALITRNRGPLTRAVRWLLRINKPLLKLQFERNRGLFEEQATELQELLWRQFDATVVWQSWRYTELILISLHDDQLTAANLNEIAQIVQDLRKGGI